MSTAIRRSANKPPTSDPYRYGWRDEEITLPNGRKEWVQTPLTLDDVLHPRMGDKIVLTTLHDRDTIYLKNVFQARTAHDESTLILHDNGVYWDVPGVRHHSPDVAVIKGVKPRTKGWRSFHVAREGVRPALIVEEVSPDTRVNDVVKKFKQYHRVRVPHYLIIDVEDEESGPRRLSLLDYHWTPEIYVQKKPNRNGRVWLEEVGVWIGVEGIQIACYDPDTGERLGDYTEIDRERKTAQSRVRELEAELERLRASKPGGNGKRKS